MLSERGSITGSSKGKKMYCGEMAEWSIAFDLKSKVLHCTVSSNLTPSFFQSGRKHSSFPALSPSLSKIPKARKKLKIRNLKKYIKHNQAVFNSIEAKNISA